MLRSRLAEVQLAIMLLTRLPVGRIKGDAPELAAARWAFPFVGVVIGTLTWAAFAGATGLGAPPIVAAFLALALLALLTGALHFDGLADYADGIGGGRDKAHALEIMRDSRVGSYGVLAMILVAGLWVTSVAELAPDVWSFVAAAVLSRAGMVALQETLPPARADGLGHDAAGRSNAARVVLLVLGVLAVLMWPVPLLACALVICAIGWQARRKIGGQTGDVLGAAQLLSETSILLAMTLL